MAVNNFPIKNLASKPIFGLEVSKASATTLEIAQGLCRDSSNKLDMSVGVDFEDLQGGTVTAPLTVDSGVVGAGGIDAGVLAADVVYSVWLIADSLGYKSTAGLLSLSSNASPTMPTGYNAMRLVGYAVTATGPAFLDMVQIGKGNVRKLLLDTIKATAVTAGASTTYADVDLVAIVPPVENALVLVESRLTPNAAGNAVSLQKYGSTGAQAESLGQVAAVELVSVDLIANGLKSSVSTISYKVSAGTDAVAINVAGFEYEV